MCHVILQQLMQHVVAANTTESTRIGRKTGWSGQQTQDKNMTTAAPRCAAFSQSHSRIYWGLFTTVINSASVHTHKSSVCRHWPEQCMRGEEEPQTQWQADVHYQKELVLYPFVEHFRIWRKTCHITVTAERIVWFQTGKIVCADIGQKQNPESKYQMTPSARMSLHQIHLSRKFSHAERVRGTITCAVTVKVKEQWTYL